MFSTFVNGNKEPSEIIIVFESINERIININLNSTTLTTDLKNLLNSSELYSKALTNRSKSVLLVSLSLNLKINKSMRLLFSLYYYYRKPEIKTRLLQFHFQMIYVPNEAKIYNFNNFYKFISKLLIILRGDIC